MHRLLNKYIDQIACMNILFSVFVVSMNPDQMASYINQKKEMKKAISLYMLIFFVIFGEFIIHQGYVSSHRLLVLPKYVIVHIRIKGEVGAVKLV